MSKAKPTLKARYKKQKWLEVALDMLARDGGARLTVRGLCSKLQVTIGSFYWHFRNREDFVRCLVDYWDEVYTKSVAREIASMNDDPAAILDLLSRRIIENELTRYDMPFRSWAAQDKWVAELVSDVDRRRYKVVRGLFYRLGFRGKDLNIRTTTYVCYYSMEVGMNLGHSRKMRIDQAKLRNAMLIRQ